MRQKSTLKEIYKQSWHAVYSNKKRKRIRSESSKRYIFFKLLDILIENKYDEKCYAASSISYDLILSKSSHYSKVDNYIEIQFLPKEKNFLLKQYDIERNDKIDHGKLSINETVNKIKSIVDNW